MYIISSVEYQKTIDGVEMLKLKQCKRNRLPIKLCTRNRLAIKLWMRKMTVLLLNRAMSNCAAQQS